MVARARRAEGFTLIELLIAVLIIGILAAIALPAFNKQRERAKDSAAQQSLEAGLRAAKAVYAEGESFPASGVGTLLGRAERSQSFAEASIFPASAGTVNVERASAQRVILRTTSASGNQHMLALDEPDSRVTRYAPPADAASSTLPLYTNLARNPSLETGTSGWLSYGNAGGATTISGEGRSSDAHSGSFSYESTFTGVSGGWAQHVYGYSGTPVVPGDRVYMAMAIKIVASSQGSLTLRLSGRMNNSGTGTPYWPALPGTVVPVGRWTVLSGYVTVPAGANQLIGLDTAILGSLPNGATVTLRSDAALLVVGSSAREIHYFDGDSPGGTWSGAAHGSTSTGYSGSASW